MQGISNDFLDNDVKQEGHSNFETSSETSSLTTSSSFLEDCKENNKKGNISQITCDVRDYKKDSEKLIKLKNSVSSLKRKFSDGDMSELVSYSENAVRINRESSVFKKCRFPKTIAFI